MRETPSVIFWLDPEQAPLMRAVAAAAGVRIVGAGSSKAGRSPDVAVGLGLDAAADSAAVKTDLRAVLATTDADAVIIASPGPFAAHADTNISDADTLRDAHARGVKVATLEPLPASILQLASGPWPDSAAHGHDHGPAAEPYRFVPLMRRSAPMLAAAEVLPDFGPIRSAVIESFGRPHEGSLGARLLDAMDLVLGLLGEPEAIDAAYMWPGTTAGGAPPPLRKLSGDTLRALQGDLTANLRYSDGRGACIALSDHGARWGRGVTLIGRSGRLRVADEGLDWIGATGARVDAATPSGAQGGAGAGADGDDGRGVYDSPDAPAVAAIADALSRYIHGREPAAQPVDYRRTLAMAAAALLSARTGEAESPETIRRMTLMPA